MVRVRAAHSPERAPQTRRVESLGRPTHAMVTAANALSDLRYAYLSEASHVSAILGTEPRAVEIVDQLNGEALQLDAMRTRLVQEGEEELDLALAYLDAGRALYRAHIVAAYRIRVEVEEAEEG